MFLEIVQGDNSGVLRTLYLFGVSLAPFGRSLVGREGKVSVPKLLTGGNKTGAE
jgi:hypothetical protein